MSQIRKSKEEIKRLHHQYLNDSIIKGFIMQKMYLLERTVPKYIVADGKFEPVYEEKTLSILDEIDKTMKDYIAYKYPELIKS